MTKYWPGPWKVDETYPEDIRDATGVNLIALAYPIQDHRGGEGVQRANADLIAAAPEMDALLEFLYGLLTKELASPDSLTTAELVDACTRIEVLQAKARGEHA